MQLCAFNRAMKQNNYDFNRLRAINMYFANFILDFVAE